MDSSGFSREAFDRLIAIERTWLDLTTMRLFTHPALPKVFTEHLIGVYHSMRTAGALMEAARLRSIALAHECPVAAQLVEYWTRHIEEEAGHDEWLLEDLRGPLGVDVERHLAAPAPPEIAELMGTLYFWILHAHPVAAVAYFYVVERSAATTQALDWLVDCAGIPREGMRTLYRHALIDNAHGRDLEALVESLPLSAAHGQLLTVSAMTVIRQLARNTERLIARADALMS